MLSCPPFCLPHFPFLPPASCYVSFVHALVALSAHMDHRMTGLSTWTRKKTKAHHRQQPRRARRRCEHWADTSAHTRTHAHTLYLCIRVLACCSHMSS